jgi:transposase-like protein
MLAPSLCVKTAYHKLAKNLVCNLLLHVLLSKQETRSNMDEKTFEEYAELMEVYLPLARKAYGSRATKSPQHTASRRYTELLVEFYSKGGSLLKLAERLGVTYAGIRRRILTDEIPAAPKGKKSRSTAEEVTQAAVRVKYAQATEGSTAYHNQIRQEYEVNKISLAKLAKELGLSSANPLYYALNRSRIESKEDIS